ncbi:AbrB/MazE/SpoVT family DNA-binding domain-containing protein [uncultured Methanobrevibacter sp.]|uniref:AbrB/MazE/SpoVT family DNA-binding domain-containing protein n=1 Tax=uncultured Methanobrevibacter sp. TaxID=253161 RepID=UPI0025D61F35|nr:AbrB/MazE/SpoVT family DNA-binding domain-containing protein [uncultured Methanobrevibacter sp.]
MKLFEVESTANLQASHSKSLRTTIPTEVVKALDLSEKDKISWTIFAEDDELVIKVSKKE